MPSQRELTPSCISNSTTSRLLSCCLLTINYHLIPQTPSLRCLCFPSLEKQAWLGYGWEDQKEEKRQGAVELLISATAHPLCNTERSRSRLLHGGLLQTLPGSCKWMRKKKEMKPEANNTKKRNAANDVFFHWEHVSLPDPCCPFHLADNPQGNRGFAVALTDGAGAGAPGICLCGAAVAVSFPCSCTLP